MNALRCRWWLVLAGVSAAIFPGGPALAAVGRTEEFVLSENGQATAISLDGTDVAVARAAGDFAADIESVSGVKPRVIDAVEKISGNLVLVGVLGQSPRIDQLVADGKLNVDGVTGAWESHVRQVIENPFPGVKRALVVAGSDRRGTIFGLYTLSETIGVSPWVWWADVPVTRKNRLAVSAAAAKQGPPAVKYRGIFLNDEDWGLQPWAAKTFEPETNDIGPKTYAKICELLLRLKANCLWPAMHPSTRAFNFYPANKLVADRYGIVMGSSHAEPMLRNNVDEWPHDRAADYNYVTNRAGVLKYWEERLQANGRYENIYTIGMRGIHDGAMPGGGTLVEKAARMAEIFADQRALLQQWVNADAARVPQIFCPYKEVLEIYRRMPVGPPDDVTLVWPDDNFGYVRQFSNPKERTRSGGAGVYYHLSYWGAPYDYLWLGTTPPALVWEEMTKAWDYGARTFWIANVGDIKPAELGLEFFLRLAWDPHHWQPETTGDFLVETAARDFGAEHAKEIAGILTDYYRLNFQRRAEHVNTDAKARSRLMATPVFSAVGANDEAEQRLALFRALEARATALGKVLPADRQAAYFQLVLYPVRGAALMNEKALNLARYQNYVEQGRANAVTFLTQAQTAHDAILRETAYYNTEMSAGKWRGIMSAAPRELGVFARPVATPPAVPDAAVLHVLPEGMTRTTGSLKLPPFSVANEASRVVEIFNGGRASLAWQAKPSADWIVPSATNGEGDARVSVTVDWTKIPEGGTATGEIVFSGAGREARVIVTALNVRNGPDVSAGAVEENGRLVVEAEQATERIERGGAAWHTIAGLGYNGNSIGAFPVTIEGKRDLVSVKKNSPELDYTVSLQSTGEIRITVRTLPHWPIAAERAPAYAIAIDDALPQLVSLPLYTDEQNVRWQEDVLRNSTLTESVHHVERGGVHTVRLWLVDPGVVFDALLLERGPTGGAGYAWGR